MTDDQQQQAQLKKLFVDWPPKKEATRGRTREPFISVAEWNQRNLEFAEIARLMELDEERQRKNKLSKPAKSGGNKTRWKSEKSATSVSCTGAISRRHLEA